MVSSFLDDSKSWSITLREKKPHVEKFETGTQRVKRAPAELRPESDDGMFEFRNHFLLYLPGKSYTHSFSRTNFWPFASICNVQNPDHDTDYAVFGSMPYLDI